MTTDDARADAVPDGRAVLRHRVPHRWRARSTGRPGGRSGSAARCATAPAWRCPTPWSRSGRPNAAGRYAIRRRRGRRSTGFGGFGRLGTARRPLLVRDHQARTGSRPGRAAAGAAPGRQRLRARPARPLVTRIYFEDEPANDADPVLRARARAPRGSLIARGGRRSQCASTSSSRAPGETCSSMSERPDASTRSFVPDPGAGAAASDRRRGRRDARRRGGARAARGGAASSREAAARDRGGATSTARRRRGSPTAPQRPATLRSRW